MRGGCGQGGHHQGSPANQAVVEQEHADKDGGLLWAVTGRKFMVSIFPVPVFLGVTYTPLA